MYVTESTSIDDKDNFLSLSKKLSTIGSRLILEALSLFKKDEARFTSQKQELVSYAKKIDKKSEINWNESAKILIAK